MKKFAIALMITALTATVAQAQVVGSIVDGHVAITLDADTALSGLNLKSAGGKLCANSSRRHDGTCCSFHVLARQQRQQRFVRCDPGHDCSSISWHPCDGRWVHRF